MVTPFFESFYDATQFIASTSSFFYTNIMRFAHSLIQSSVFYFYTKSRLCIHRLAKIGNSSSRNPDNEGSSDEKDAIEDQYEVYDVRRNSSYEDVNDIVILGEDTDYETPELPSYAVNRP